MTAGGDPKVYAAADGKLLSELPRDIVLQWLHQLRHFEFTEGTALGARLLARARSVASLATLVH